jgi:hypothetical protein
VKLTTPAIRASHVNTGTAVSHDELLWPDSPGAVLRLPKLHAEIDSRSEVTPYGGLMLVAELCRRFHVSKVIDRHVHVLKAHKPYHESDHVLALAMNLFVGGTCIEDLGNLQQSEAVRRLLGACRLPDPTTAGDFLRRFNSKALGDLRRANDEIQSRIWKKQRRLNRDKAHEWALIDLDGHTKKLYGHTKQGADFSRKGEWSYHPLLVSLANTGECLAIRNRPGNVRSSNGAAEVLTELLPRMRSHFARRLVRADSDFDRRDVRDACEAEGACFAFVGREHDARRATAAGVTEGDWKPFRTRAARHRAHAASRPDYRRRKKKDNLRRRRARQRNYKELKLAEQWMAEVPWTPPDSDKTYRLVIRRQLIEHRKGQQFLFTQYRYRYVVTNLPRSVTTEQVLDLTYQRCDQENVIEQMGSGLAAWRMPVAEFDGNCAWLEIGRLAWNLAKWLALLALPEEVLRWEWKRFRQAWVYLAAQVITRSRQIWLRFSSSHRFVQTLVAAHRKLQT